MNFQLNDVGIMLDIAGGTILAYGFMSKTTEKIFREAASTWDRNSNVAEFLLSQKFEAIVGFTFLAIGFILQLIGNQVKLSNFHDLSFYIISLTIILSIFITFKLSKTYATRESAKYIKYLEEQNKPKEVSK